MTKRKERKPAETDEVEASRVGRPVLVTADFLRAVAGARPDAIRAWLAVQVFGGVKPAARALGKSDGFNRFRHSARRIDDLLAAYAPRTCATCHENAARYCATCARRHLERKNEAKKPDETPDSKEIVSGSLDSLEGSGGALGGNP